MFTHEHQRGKPVKAEASDARRDGHTELPPVVKIEAEHRHGRGEGK